MATIEERIKHFRTAPFDPRFPQTNQARSCFQNYIDFHRCERVFNEKGKDTTPCEYFKLCYNSLCPNEWKDKFDTWRENETFPTKL